MWKWGLTPHNSFSKDICFEFFSVMCLCSVWLSRIGSWTFIVSKDSAFHISKLPYAYRSWHLPSIDQQESAPVIVCTTVSFPANAHQCFLTDLCHLRPLQRTFRLQENPQKFFKHEISHFLGDNFIPPGSGSGSTDPTESGSGSEILKNS